MHLRSTISFLSALLVLSPHAYALRLIESKSLTQCQDNSNFTATLFNVIFTPDNNTLTFDVVGVSSIQGNVTAQLLVVAYGFTALNQTLDPCQNGLGGLCPMSTGQINIQSNLIVSKDVTNKIPGILYGVPDLDFLVRIYIKDKTTSVSLACVEAELSNGKTIYQKAVGWTTAVIAGLAFIASGVTSGLGHTNTAAHVAANALSLFGFFQAQAIIGMSSVKMPPIVQSWTQNFQWSMGIIRVGFLQSICTWYQRATGGTASTYLSTLATTSVSVQKRSLEIATRVVYKAVAHVGKRTNTGSTVAEIAKVLVVRGIERVGFRANIEKTNIFLTGFIFFIVFSFLIGILVALFKLYCESAVKAGWMKHDTFSDFRNGWKLVLKGIVFRLVLVGYPQMCVLCFWELIERDSAAEVILAIFMILSMSFTLGWASWKVIRLAKRSLTMHKNPAYMLYSDPKCLNKWGFLYVQYRATAYYFVLPMLAYTLVKGVFIAFAQGAPVAQAIGLVVVEAVLLIAVGVLKPWMDRKTNIFNISIATINLVNALFLLVFTAVFGQPAIVTGIMGVVFVIYNVVFALVLLILVLIASVYAVASKNPDNRYQPMRDDRGSFIKSQAALTTELDALGQTARGDTKSPFEKERGFEDTDSWSSSSLIRQQQEASGVPLPPSTANSAYQRGEHEHRPPVARQPMLPADSSGLHGPPSRQDAERGMYQQEHHGSEYSSRAGSRLQEEYHQPYSNNFNVQDLYLRPNASSHSQQQPPPRQANNSSPWQRGAGYD